MLLVLASGSPRRREILEALGVAFEVRATGADETPRPHENARDLARRIARLKCEHAMALDAQSAILAADTVVDVDGVPLNKPESDDDARRMLRSLSGRVHSVHTGIALAVAGRVEVRSVTTEVVFLVLDAGVIDRYVASGEGRDKAGAYAMQGMGAGLLSEVRGSPSNVIGLPAAETLALLVERGVLPCWPPERA